MSVSSPVIDFLDLSTKHIHLLSGCREYHPVEDIYCEVRNIRRLDESMRVFDIPVVAEGAVPKGGGKFTPRYAIFNHGWRVVPEDISHDLYISGEQITDDGQSGKACLDLLDLSPGTNIFVHYEPPAAEIIRDEQALAAIESMAFNRRIAIDVIDGVDSDDKDAGTYSKPVKTLSKVKELSDKFGFKAVDVIGDITLNTSHNFKRFTFIGESPKKSKITIEPIADVFKTEFENANVEGTLDGNSELLYCETGDINYVDGTIKQCMLTGTITLSGNAQADFLWPVSGVAGTDTPEISMAGSGSSLAMRGLEGGILISHKTGPEAVSIDLQSGQAKIDMATVINGKIVVRGDGKCIDSVTGEHLWSGMYGDLEILNETNSARANAREIWESMLDDYDIPGTAGDILNSLAAGATPAEVAAAVWADSEAVGLIANVQFIKSIEGGKWKIESNHMIFFEDDNTTEVARFALFGSTGLPTSTDVFERVRQ